MADVARVIARRLVAESEDEIIHNIMAGILNLKDGMVHCVSSFAEYQRVVGKPETPSSPERFGLLCD